MKQYYSIICLSLIISSSPYAARASVVAWYRYEGGTPGNLISSVSNGVSAQHDAIVNSGEEPVFSADTLGDIIDPLDVLGSNPLSNAGAQQCLSNQANSHIRMPATVHASASSFSIECFVKRNGAASTGELSIIDAGGFFGAEGWHIKTAFNQLDKLNAKFRSNGTNTYLSPAIPVSDNYWHHLALTYNHLTGEARFYVDLSMHASATVAGSFNNASNTLPIIIGYQDSQTPDLLIDEVRFHDSAIGADEFLRRDLNTPNLILVMADDLSAKDMGVYGDPFTATPNLQSMADSGVQFSTCWATPLCSPSRALIMTGVYGIRTTWLHNNYKPAGDFSLSFETAAHILGGAGYKSAMVGKYQLAGPVSDKGFDESYLWSLYPGFNADYIECQNGNGGTLCGRAARYWHPAIVYDDNSYASGNTPVPVTEQDYGPDMFIDFVLDFAERKRDEGSPFFVYYPMVLPHASWDFDIQVAGYLPVPDTVTGIKDPGSTTLVANVEYIDHLMGRLWQGIEDLGLASNTVLLFTSDNGTSGYGKSSLVKERGPRVPMIVHGAGIAAVGETNALIEFADIVPTLIDLSVATNPAGYALDGESFAHVLKNEPGATRDTIFSYLFDRRFIRDDRFLLDGNGVLWDTWESGSRKSEEEHSSGFTEVTYVHDDPDVVAARNKFFEILKTQGAPLPPDIDQARTNAGINIPMFPEIDVHFTGIDLGGGQAAISFENLTGGNFGWVVEETTNLIDAPWTPVSVSDITGPDAQGLFEATLPGPVPPQAFWRIGVPR